MRCVLGLLAALVPTAAHATGLCEDTGVTYGTPTLYSEASDAFAIPATLAWCEEREDGGALDEDRGSIELVELRDVRGNVTRISAASGDDAARLEAGVGTFDHVARDKLAAELTARGFAPFVTRSPASVACTVRAMWTDAGANDGGWPTDTLFAEVRAGSRKLKRQQLGAMAEVRHGDEAVIAHFIAKRRKIALFTLRPTCAGPPPGYFGPDDGGVCYHQDHVETSLVDASTGPLARCFTKP